MSYIKIALASRKDAVQGKSRSSSRKYSMPVTEIGLGLDSFSVLGLGKCQTGRHALISNSSYCKQTLACECRLHRD